MRSTFPVFRSTGENFIQNPAQYANYLKKYERSAQGCLQYVTAIIRNEVGAILVGYNKKHGNRQIPSGKVDAGEDIETTLSREIEEELNVEVTKATPLGKSKVIYNGMVREGHFFATEIEGTLQAQEPETMHEFKRMQFTSETTELGRWLTEGQWHETISDSAELLSTRHMFAELYWLLNCPDYQAVVHAPVQLPQEWDAQKIYTQTRDSNELALIITEA